MPEHKTGKRTIMAGLQEPLSAALVRVVEKLRSLDDIYEESLVRMLVLTFLRRFFRAHGAPAVAIVSNLRESAGTLDADQAELLGELRTPNDATQKSWNEFCKGSGCTQWYAGSFVSCCFWYTWFLGTVSKRSLVFAQRGEESNAAQLTELLRSLINRRFGPPASFLLLRMLDCCNEWRIRECEVKINCQGCDRCLLVEGVLDDSYALF